MRKAEREYDPSTGLTPLRSCVNDLLLIDRMLRVTGFEVRQCHDRAATQRGILEVEPRVSQAPIGRLLRLLELVPQVPVERPGAQRTVRLPRRSDMRLRYRSPGPPLTDRKFVRISTGRAGRSCVLRFRLLPQQHLAAHDARREDGRRSAAAVNTLRQRAFP